MTVISAGNTSVEFDPRDSRLFSDERRDAVFARLRESNALHVDRRGSVPIYSLVRHTDVSRAYKEPEVFSPCAGLTLDAFDPTQCESPSRMLEMAPPDWHRALRSTMQSAFRGSRVTGLAGKIDSLLSQLFTKASGGDPLDFVEAFARPAASLTISEILGVDETEAARLDSVLRALAAIDPGASSPSIAQRRKVELRLLRELTRVVRTHREREGSTGLVAMLLAAEPEGKALSEHDVVLNCLNVVVAGMGAMQHTLAGAVAVWSEQAVELSDVAEEPELRSRLIDETLRWLTPLVHLTRIVARDTEASGQELPRGAGVCLWNISANRDEDVFEDAGTFRPDRPPRRHLAFGAGPQHCLGAQLVRAQLLMLLEGMLRHGVRFELGGSPRWVRSNTITGVELLPVKLRRVEPMDVQTTVAELAPTSPGHPRKEIHDFP